MNYPEFTDSCSELTDRKIRGIMSEENNILSSLDWAINTIRDQILFGLDELGAAKARELRAKGVMIDTVEYIKELENSLKAMIELNENNCKIASRKEQEFYDHCKHYDGIEKKLEIACEALGFYGNNESWLEYTGYPDCITEDDLSDYPHITRDVRRCGGKRAREALKKIKGDA